MRLRLEPCPCPPSPGPIPRHVLSPCCPAVPAAATAVTQRVEVTVLGSRTHRGEVEAVWWSVALRWPFVVVVAVAHSK